MQNSQGDWKGASMINGSGLTGYSGMTMDQVQGLVGLLDESTASGTIQRPESQSTGYSLAETENPEVKKSGYGEANSKVVANSNPGAIFVPDSVKDRQTLPQPSQAKKIVTNTVSALPSQGRKKPKGNDIWTTEEVDMESHIAPAPKIVQEIQSVLAQTAAAAPAETSKPKAEDDARESKTEASTAEQSKTAPATTPAASVSVDRRQSPEYEILYKQTNTAEDTYLSMDFTRDGSTAMSCDQLAVKVQLPLLDKGVADIELDVDTWLMTLRTRDYLLKAPLPEPCVPKKGKAQWDEQKKILTVVLTVDTTDRKVKVM